MTTLKAVSDDDQSDVEHGMTRRAYIVAMTSQEAGVSSPDGTRASDEDLRQDIVSIYLNRLVEQDALTSNSLMLVR